MMSSLTLSVAILAAVAVLVVVTANVWLSRRASGFRRNRQTPAAGGAAARAEPSLGIGEVGDAESQLGALPTEASVLQPAPRGGQSVLDAYTDCIVSLELQTPIAAERLDALWSRFRRVGSKPVTLEGGVVPEGSVRDALAPDGDSGSQPRDRTSEPPELEWRTPQPGLHYDRVRVGVLLANRSGPLNAMEFSEFVAGVQSLADQLSVLADTPEMSAVLARARALDELCASLDAQAGLGVSVPDALGLEDLARIAAQAGCVERGNNRHVRLGPGGEVIFSLALGDAPGRLTLLLDVPRVPPEPPPWTALLDCAKWCADRLGGRVVDDSGRPLNDAHLTLIGEQIAQRQQALDDAGFLAGSPLALRLFN